MRNFEPALLQRVVNGSDLTCKLIVSGLTPGSYKFSLTVTNIRGKSASDDVSVKVKPNPHLNHLVSKLFPLPRW